MNRDKVVSTSSKPHFELLDGLRGIAALAVVLFHFMEIATPDYRDNFIPRSYLAVDFFFCLSGFVMAYAYDRKINAMGIFTFFKRRLIRLQPFVLIGSIIGLFAFLFDPFSDLVQSFSSLDIPLMFGSSSLLIPYPMVPQRYFNLFHLNPPTWSLFWEYIANIFYALILCRLPVRTLQLLLIIAASLLCYTSYQHGYLAVGFGGDNFWAGAARLFFSFIAGIVLFRSKWKININPSLTVLILLFIATFFIPFSEKYGAYIDVFLVIIYFPLLIGICAAKGQLRRTASQLCKRLGDISYPLYMVHYPFVWIFMSYVETYKPNGKEMALIISLSVLLLIALAYLILKWIDIPLRNYLTRKFLRNGTSPDLNKTH